MRACTARRDADTTTFPNIERLEQENQRLRAEVKWKLEHASMRTGTWVRSRVTILVWVLAGMAGFTGWLFTPNGRVARVSGVGGFYAGYEPPSVTWNHKHFMTSDMSQHDIDSLRAALAADDAMTACRWRCLRRSCACRISGQTERSFSAAQAARTYGFRKRGLT